MKKFIKLSSLLIFFILVSNQNVYSQDFIKNNTECKFSITVLYSDMSNEECEVIGSATFSIAAGAVQIIPNDYLIIEAKGFPIIGGCPFYISRGDCGPNDYYDKVACENSCTALYKAQFLPGVGMEIYD